MRHITKAFGSGATEIEVIALGLRRMELERMAIEAPARAGRFVADFHRRRRAGTPALGVATTGGTTATGSQRSLTQRFASVVRSKITATGNRIGDMGNSGVAQRENGSARAVVDHTPRNRAPAAALLTCWFALPSTTRIVFPMPTIIPLADARASSQREKRSTASCARRRSASGRRGRWPTSGQAVARPPHLGHGPLQLPLRLLHAEGESTTRLPRISAARGAAHVRGDHARSPGSSSTRA